MDMQLEGKRALVTGSSSGIGRAIAESLAREGAIVVVHGRDAQRLEDVARGIREAGGKAFTVVGDVGSSDAVRSVADAALQQTGGIDILVNNAGGRASRGSGDLMDASLEEWLGTMRINLLSALELSRTLSEGMRARNWGRIINISSAAGSLVRLKSPADYAASKAALNSLTLSLANALRNTGISVVTVSPGPVLTPSLEGFIERVIRHGRDDLDFAQAEAIAAKEYFNVPLGRLGRPEEVAALVTLLASPLGGFCNATNLHVDGGSIGTIN